MNSSVFAHRRCLVLNKNWAAVGTVSLQRAIIMLFSTYADGEPKARVIDHESYQPLTWDDWSKLKPVATDEVIRAANIQFRIPEVILLSRYGKLPQPKAHFSRRNLFKRDEGKCQYCGIKVGNEGTIDHVVPRSQGGQTTWENCALSCVECNSRKADRTPDEAKMALLKKPVKPKLHLLRFNTLKPVKSWSAFIGEAYWNCELENDNE